MSVKSLLAVLVCVILASAAHSQSKPAVVEASITASTGSGLLHLSIPVESSAPANVRLQLELINEQEHVIATSNKDTRIAAGRTVIARNLAIKKDIDVSEITWTRLRYTLGANGSRSTGIVSLSQFLPELFTLTLLNAEDLRPGASVPVRIRAKNPITDRPIAGVKIEAEMEIDIVDKNDEDDNELTIKGESVTDAEGYATIEFWIPETVKFEDDNSIDLSVSGSKNGVTDLASDTITSRPGAARVYFTLDKPIYQPGQVLRARALILRDERGSDLKTPIAGKEIELTIEDEDNTVLFKQKSKTSDFGITAIEWAIPPNAKLGTYRIKSGSDEEDLDLIDRQQFRVTRYDLPNFVVQTKSDRDFYLPDQREAEVTVIATYLFGKPVTSGTVKIVRESKREWNFKEQKWDVGEEETYTGSTDADGSYKAKIDLGKAHEALKEDESEKFKDLGFTAYFTDPTTNRTEQRRFDIRVSKEPIHVYLNFESREDASPNLPVIVYVSTSTADGEPVACDVDLDGRWENEKSGASLASAKTNSNGLAKLRFDIPRRSDGDYDNDLELKFTAREGDRTGTTEHKLDVDDEKKIRVSTDKTLYKPGNPLRLEIESSEPAETVFVDILKDSSALVTKRVRTVNGRASLTIPYQAKFKGYLEVSAYTEDDGDAVQSTRRIVFPDPKNLEVTARSEKQEYRPNDEARLDFGVSGPNNRPTESAVGLVIVDQAVEERARTDSKFGVVPDVFSGLRGLVSQLTEIAGGNVTDEMQLAAENGLTGSRALVDSTESYVGTPSNKFDNLIRPQFDPVGKALRARFDTTFRYPTDDRSLRLILAWGGVDFDALRDPWGMPYFADFGMEKDKDTVEIKSSGPNKTRGDGDDFSVKSESFRYLTETGLKINAAVAEYVERSGKLITDEAMFSEVLAANGIDFDSLRDKCGRPYRLKFGAIYRNQTIDIMSDGKNQEEEWDDFSAWQISSDYFAADQKRISAALSKFVTTNRRFPSDEPEFRKLLAESGIDPDALRDGWNRPYFIEFETFEHFADRAVIGKSSFEGVEVIRITPVTQKIARFTIKSRGPELDRDWDDVSVSVFSGIVSEKTIESAKPKLVVPRAVLANGNGAIFGVVSDANKSVIADAEMTATNFITKTEYKTRSDAEGNYLLTGVPAGIYTIKFTLPGFKVMVFNLVRLASEQLLEINTVLEAGSVNEVMTVSALVDVSDSRIETSIDTAIIENRTVPVPRVISGGVLSLRIAEGVQVDGASGSENVFLIDGQKVTNFRTGIFSAEFGRSGQGLVNVVTKSGGGGGGGGREETETPQKTPRLREYFPETLLFIPEIVTTKNGKAAIKYRLADNITTWKIYAVASDKQGRVGFAETSVKAFQPFFADLDPPKFLTVGDEIRLPVQIRNYTPQVQRVEVRMDRADWFTFVEPNVDSNLWPTPFDGSRRMLDVATNSSANAVFGFRADRAVDDGRQRVTALANADSDAIEKPVTVRPDGEEISRTDSRIFNGSSEFQLDFPANALPESNRAELTIYPNLLSHVEESIEGLLRRPYGCAEQTISSTYPNLMILKVTGDDNEDRKKLRARALKNLRRGYDRLVGYQSSDGGFSYWGGKGDTDVALTAYALRFLSDATGIIEVDDSIVENARRRLIALQRGDGSWSTQYTWETSEDTQRTRKITAFVARVLAMSMPKRDPKATENSPSESALKNALAYLKTRNAEIDEPYALANYGLAALDSGDTETARQIANKLSSMAIAEGADRVYWNLETNTPFYGWGTPGRIETTALVLQLLAKVASTESRVESSKSESRSESRVMSRESGPSDSVLSTPDSVLTKDSVLSTPDSELISKATLFLLKNKDRYGVWYSTQATVNVLDAFLATLTKPTAQKITVSVGGTVVRTIDIPADQIEPATVDLTDRIAPGTKVEVTASNESKVLSQLVTSHYIDWKDSQSTSRNVNQSRAVEFGYTCDKTNGRIMDTVTCSVSAERVGFKGYGMLLAEIGIPPGAEVSRESLEKAMVTSSGVSRYEIQPDRIVVYMWANPGGTKFSFSFKPRYGINAQTPASVLYDYYNEEAKATVAPIRFRFDK